MLHEVCQEIVHGLLSGFPTAVLAALTTATARRFLNRLRHGKKQLPTARAEQFDGTGADGEESQASN
ncbi:hypothetical protein [Streptomyces sp. AcE210]|uniref:hypothetical protein n=1 Tax=Streptomyces sp. AcE210 TaxID=2292703 RepID=UPI000E306725|nr:hypothetical protein [Streptomyces sp. AcE210]RFC78283.1 hypothetical protein DXZ75_11405 [Streptomyces sp. AcE210]